MATSYETDFYGWSNEQAALLRAGRLSEADIENISEEIESLGKSVQQQLESFLTVLLLHLLKWRHQPARRGRSWRYTIIEQRRRINRHLRKNPSLKSRLDETMTDAYGDALLEAFRETDLPESTFPADCPWAFDQLMDDGFWPQET